MVEGVCKKAVWQIAALAPAFTGALYQSWRARRVDTAEVLRYA